jgi:hypothetical protein
MSTQKIHSERRFSHLTYLAVILTPIRFLISCSDNGTSVEEPQNVEQVDDFLKNLPSWNQFAPAESTQPPTPAGERRGRGGSAENGAKPNHQTQL